MRQLPLVLMFLFVVNQIVAQVTVQGYVKSDLTKKSLYKADIQLGNYRLKGDRLGFFQFREISEGKYTLTIRYRGYESHSQEIIVKKKKIKIGKVFLQYNPSVGASGVLLLDEDGLTESEDTVNSQALLSASQDFYGKRTRVWSGYWVRSRGLEGQDQSIQFNGYQMKNPETGRINYSQWSGLNDLIKKPFEATYGLEPSSYNLLQLAGHTEIETNPLLQSKQTKITLSKTNRSYKNRAMVTYFTGMNEKDWAFSVIANARWAKEGRREGTEYQSASLFLGVGKKWNDKNQTYLTAFVAPYERSSHSANTSEAYNLKGKGYNAYWGWLDGEKKNERVKKGIEPLIQLSHVVQPNERVEIKTSLTYQGGERRQSRLNRFTPKGETFTSHHSPTYYRNMPSFFRGDEFYQQYYLWQTDESVNQINWKSLIEANKSSPDGIAKYYLAENVTESKNWAWDSQGKYQLKNESVWNTQVSFRLNQSKHYQELSDLLGALIVENKDQYADYLSFDTETTSAKKGEKIGYSYGLTSQHLGWNNQWEVQNKKIKYSLSVNMTSTKYQREGYFRHYNRALESYGKSKKINYLDYGLGVNLVYPLKKKQHLVFNAKHFTQVPTANQVFLGARESNLSLTPSSASVWAAEMNYHYRSDKLKAKATVYYLQKNKETETQYYYSDFIQNLVAEELINVNKRHLGLELAMEYPLLPALVVTALMNIGNHQYTNSPDVYLYQSSKETPIIYQGESKIKNYKVASSPQQTYSLGLKYNGKKYWWIGVDVNYLSQNYSDFNALLRTEAFTTSDGIPLPSGLTEEEIAGTLNQERFTDEFLVNFQIGKTISLGKYYGGLMLFVNNVMDNQEYVTAGYQQARYSGLADYVADSTSEKPLFSSKKWYDSGRTYYLNLFFKF